MAQVGQILGDRYRLVELLGQGGMATIFRAHDAQLVREVAVKVLRAEYGRDAAFVARFRQEAQSAAALSHPNVVRVFDYGMEHGDPFIVMELVEGGDLAGVIRERGALEPRAAARIAQQVFDALASAHGRGIVHRDIKTTNVLLTRDGRALVADFGIARAFSEAQLTMPGTTLGSVHYFSPEQARGEMVTTASDVYSAGLVLFEMLTARRAWTGDSAGAVAVARLAGDPPAPSSIQPGIPVALDVIVRRTLARVPAQRPSAAELSELLVRFVADPASMSAAAAAGTAGTAGTAGAAGAAGAAGLAAAGAGGFGGAGAGPGGGAPSGPLGGPPRDDAYAASPTYGTTARRGQAVRQRPYRDERVRREQEEEEEPSGSGPWGWIAGILGVLILVAGGALLFLLLSGRGTPAGSPTPATALVEMPVFVGQLLPAAQQSADDAGLIMTVGSFELSNEAPENTVISQDPPAGGQVARGTRVTVTVATQRLTVFVPDLHLRTEPELVSILMGNGLVPGVRSESYDPAVPATLVIRTNPRLGIEVARGTTVDYTLSLGPQPTPAPVPTLAPPATPGPPPTLAPPATPGPPPTPTPLVPTQPPPTPIIITPGPPPTPEIIFITPPPPPPTPVPVTVGNYADCGTLGAAKALITNPEVGLVVGAIFPSTADDSWLVAGQYPASGTQVPPGTLVHLHVKDPVTETCP